MAYSRLRTTFTICGASIYPCVTVLIRVTGPVPWQGAAANFAFRCQIARITGYVPRLISISVSPTGSEATDGNASLPNVVTDSIAIATFV